MPNRFDSDLEFDWDLGNLDKNWLKHKVNYKEAEQAFFDQKALRTVDLVHSHAEDRWLLLGKTDKSMLLSIFFTVRNNKIRVISARPMSRKERNTYENQTV